jgi:hypothetical protein
VLRCCAHTNRWPTAHRASATGTADTHSQVHPPQTHTHLDADACAPERRRQLVDGRVHGAAVGVLLHNRNDHHLWRVGRARYRRGVLSGGGESRPNQAPAATGGMLSRGIAGACVPPSASQPRTPPRTWMGAMFGGRRRPLSSPCVMMMPPMSRVDAPQLDWCTYLRGVGGGWWAWASASRPRPACSAARHTPHACTPAPPPPPPPPRAARTASAAARPQTAC